MNCYYNLKELRSISHEISFTLNENIKYDQMKQDTITFISTSISIPNSLEHSIKTKKCWSPPQQPASATKELHRVSYAPCAPLKIAHQAQLALLPLLSFLASCSALIPLVSLLPLLSYAS